MDIVERLRESDNDTEYVSPIGNERRLTLAWEAAEEIERLRERVAYLEGCQCKACKDGVKHWSDCAVHNGDALPVSQCDCGVVATPNDLGNRRAAFGASVLTDGLAGKRTE